MRPNILKEKIISIKKSKINKKDSGSTEFQIILLTEKIKKLTIHFNLNVKDNHSKRGLLKIVNNRKKLLRYIKNKNYKSYINLIKTLGLRK